MTLEEYLVENNDCTNLPDMHQYTEAEVNKIEWKKAIFVFLIKYDNKPVV